jgi:hypothetical protein
VAHTIYQAAVVVVHIPTQQQQVAMAVAALVALATRLRWLELRTQVAVAAHQVEIQLAQELEKMVDQVWSSLGGQNESLG